MTRKDYVAIATALACARATARCHQNESLRAATLQGVTLAMHELTLTLATDNPRFDRGRFIAAATKD
jgi:hypothetical protein